MITIRLLFLSTLLYASGAVAQQYNHKLVIGNLDEKKGTLYIGWYTNADDFRKHTNAVFKKIVDVAGKDSVPVPFENVPPGIYAVAVFFDTNGNGKMDTNIFGIPKEKYGFSNNVYPLMRPASFKESAFSVTDGSSKIRLK